MAATPLPSQHRPHRKGIGIFILLIPIMSVDGKLVVLAHQLEVVVDVMKQRHPTGPIIRATAHHAVAIVLGLAIRQRQAILADLVRQHCW